MKSMGMFTAGMALCLILFTGMPVAAQNPFVEAAIPAQNEINVPSDILITVFFDQPMELGSFDFASTFVVQGSQTGLHAGFFDYGGSPNEVVFDNLGPPFAWGETISVTLTTGLMSGLNMLPLDRPYVFTFTIEAMRGPAQFLGTSTIPVGFIPYGIYAAEMNGTGTDIDLVVSGWTDFVVVLENQGGGVFSAADTSTVGTLPQSIVGFDNNLDGRVDLATANWQDNNITILINEGNLNFFVLQHKTVGMTPTTVIAADLNGDGFKDLAVTNWNSNTVSVLFNLFGDGFTNPDDYVTGIAPRYVAAADIDHDWDLDLVVADQGSSSLTIYENEATGLFLYAGTISVPAAPMSVVIANLDGIGLPDYATTSYTGSTVSVFLRDASGQIDPNSYPVETTPRNMVAIDIDGDLDLDLAASNYDSSKVSVLLNNGDGTFAQNMPYTVGDNPYGIAGADLDGDGDMDLATSNYSSRDVTILEPIPLIIIMYMEPANLVNMLIRDPLGRRLGFDEFSTYYDEIPTGSYYQPFTTDSAFILEPLQGEYIIEFHPQLRKMSLTTYSAIIKTDGTLEAVAVNDETADKQALYTYFYHVEEGYHYKNGDANRDEAINVADAVHIINYVFKGGPEPYPIYAGDANCDKSVNVADAVYIINFVFKGGNKPCCCELCGDECR